jgi:hypothetical protein
MPYRTAWDMATDLRKLQDVRLRGLTCPVTFGSVAVSDPATSLRLQPAAGGEFCQAWQFSPRHRDIAGQRVAAGVTRRGPATSPQVRGCRASATLGRGRRDSRNTAGQRVTAAPGCYGTLAFPQVSGCSGTVTLSGPAVTPQRPYFTNTP